MARQPTPLNPNHKEQLWKEISLHRIASKKYTPRSNLPFGPDQFFSYTPLDKARKEIRLFRLRSKKYEPPPDLPYESDYVCGELVTTPRDTAPPYIALSYCWGLRSEVKTIYISQKPFLVTLNLYQALKELRHEERDVILWIDFLCINQLNEDEKSNQVQNMSNVYSEASKVIAWLGLASDDTPFLFALIQAIGERVNQNKDDLLRPEKGDQDSYTPLYEIFANEIPELSQLQTYERIRKAYESLCKSEYWQRIWVIQEASLGKVLTIQCGSSQVDYLDLVSLTAAVREISYWSSMSCFVDMPPTGSPVAQVDGPLTHVQFIHYAFSSREYSFMAGVLGRRGRYITRTTSDSYNLAQVVTLTMGLYSDYNYPQCSDARDRIFGVMTMANDIEDFPLFPNYSMTVQEVYTETTKQFIRQGFTDILGYCQGSVDKSLPTWVPDWRQPTFVPNFSLILRSSSEIPSFAASGKDSRPQFDFSSNSTLKISGFRVDVVEEVGSEWDPDWLAEVSPSSFRKVIEDIENFVWVSQMIASDDKKSAVSRICNADAWNRYGWGLDCQEGFDKFRDTCFNMGSAYERHAGDDVDWFVTETHRLHHLRPFRTLSGYVGLAHSRVVAGDVLCILSGAHFPYCLRHVGNNEFNVAGEAYAHGIMYGEYLENSPESEVFTLR